MRHALRRGDEPGSQQVRHRLRHGDGPVHSTCVMRCVVGDEPGSQQVRHALRRGDEPCSQHVRHALRHGRARFTARASCVSVQENSRTAPWETVGAPGLRQVRRRRVHSRCVERF